MAKTTKKVKKGTSTDERLKAFAKTITQGVSPKYMEHLKKEAKENRFIEKYL